MNPKTMPGSDRFALRMADLAIRHPWRVILATLLLTVIASSGMMYLDFYNNYRVFFGPDNPELLAFENFENTYTKNDNIMFVLQSADGNIFAPELTDAVEAVTREAWKIPYAIRVDSVTNFQHSWADGDELTVEDLIRDGKTLSEQDLNEKRAIALNEPLLNGNLVSPDADTTGINVTLQYPGKSISEVPQAAGAARAIAAQTERDYPGVRVALSGISMLNNAFAESAQKDSVTLVPIMFVTLVLFMIVILRSFAGTLTTLLVIGFSTATALGLSGFAGVNLSPVSASAPVVILTLAIADSIHVLMTFFNLMRKGHDKRSALRESLRINFLAVLITSVTTIVGFLSLNFSDAPPYKHLGNITSVGIAAALLYTMTLLPALLRVLPLKVRRRSSSAATEQTFLPRLSAWVTGHYRPILAVLGIVTIGLVTLVPSIDLNDEFVKYFDYRVPFRGDAEFAIENLNGIYLLEYSLEADSPGGISSPSYLSDLERFTDWLRSQPEVMHVYSYTDIIKRLNKNMHADDEFWYRVPEDRELAAQYLLLYELSLPYGLDLNDRISIDKSATRVTASVGDISTVEIRELVRRSESWLQANTPEHMWTRPTGGTVMFSYISQRNIESMLRGNAVAVLLIAGIMILALRSFSIGALSLIPNSVPILITFGTWAILVGQVGMAASIVSATSLGIVVDDTVHFLSKFLRARREQHLNRPEAIRYAFETVGPAMIGTTLILAFGFGVLATSTFLMNSQMGLLTSLVIVIALVVDFLLMPALLMIGHKPQEQEGLSYGTALVQAS